MIQKLLLVLMLLCLPLGLAGKKRVKVSSAREKRLLKIARKVDTAVRKRDAAYFDKHWLTGKDLKWVCDKAFQELPKSKLPEDKKWQRYRRLRYQYCVKKYYNKEDPSYLGHFHRQTDFYVTVVYGQLSPMNTRVERVITIDDNYSSHADMPAAVIRILYSGPKSYRILRVTMLKVNGKYKFVGLGMGCKETPGRYRDE
ncbi:MAG: hypothetical protein AAF518_11190 [Spirochaetota bacterium]